MSEPTVKKAWEAVVLGRWAVQDGFVPPDAFVEVLFGHVFDGEGASMGDLLESRGMLTAFQRKTLEQRAASMVGPSASEDASAASVDPAARYTIGEILQQGGAGRIYRANDSVIGRPVAVKSMLDPQSEVARRRFENEYRITGGLDHPNIISVHDACVSEALGPMYVMRLLQGDTLREVLRHAQAAGTPGRTALLRIFLDICAALAYAHSHGVIHRDLKPSNIMVGEFGEVQVMDWGIALRLVNSHLPTPPLSSKATLPHQTNGEVAGTPGYMAPEQVRGELALDPRADIFALGCILYELLTGRFPFQGSDVDAYLTALEAGPPLPPGHHDASIGEELDEITMAALAISPDERLGTVREMSAAISMYLEGTRTQELRQKRALSKVVEGIQARSQLQQHEAHAQQLLGELRGEQARIRPFDLIEKKRPLWDKEKQVEQHEKDVMVRLGEAISAFTQALALNPESEEAQGQLADLYYERLINAERHRDSAGVAYHESMLQRHNDGRYDLFLKDQGSVWLRSDPPGASVTLYALEEKDRIMTPDEGTVLGETPLGPVVLATGSYLAVMEKPGFATTRVPIWVAREKQHVARGRLYKEEDIPAGYTYIPQGHFVMGGDPLTASAGRVSHPFLPDIFVATLPTSIEDYLAFLNDVRETAPEEGRLHGPRRSPDGGYYLERGAKGVWALPGLDEDGDSWDPIWPVFAVSWYDADAYATWRAEADGIPCRLPLSAELEKAARGVDGRYYPWGDKFDATFCKMGQSRPGPPKPEPIGAYPLDVSVYGVQDLGGGIREWCGDVLEVPDGAIAFGGNWSGSELTSRAAHRWFLQKGQVAPGIGLRLAMDAEAMPYHEGFPEERFEEGNPIQLPRLPEISLVSSGSEIPARLAAPKLWTAITNHEDGDALAQLALATTDAGASWALIQTLTDDIPLATAGDAPEAIPRSLLSASQAMGSPEAFGSQDELPQVSPFVLLPCGEPPVGYFILPPEHPIEDTDLDALCAAAALVLTRRREREQLTAREDQARDDVEDVRKELTIVREALATLAPDTYLRDAFPLLDGRSRPMRRLFRMLERLVQSEVNVLIRGESGVGKERVARTIHQHGAHPEGPFVAVNCGAMPENLIESELFGHTKGAFTGAVKAEPGLFRRADGGTLFLDEIAELSLEAQVKLLRALQNRAVRPVGDHTEYPFHARILAATHKDLKQLVEDGTFREDLYWRIVVVELEIPPLRERPEDVPLLIAQFFADWKQDVEIAEDAMALLQAYQWPGNVRELENELRRALVIADKQIETSQLSHKIREGEAQSTRLQGSLRDIVAQVERDAIQFALQQAKNNKAETARNLGLSKRGLQLKMQRYGL